MRNHYTNVNTLFMPWGEEIDVGYLWVEVSGILVLVDDDCYVEHPLTDDFIKMKNI